MSKFDKFIVFFYDKIEPFSFMIFSLIVITIGMLVFTYFDYRNYKKIIKAMGDFDCKEVIKIEQHHLKIVIRFNIFMYIFSVISLVVMYEIFIKF